jgi:hypothetical protein
VEQIEDDEIEEIHEEEATLISWLEELVAELTGKYDELGYGLCDFIEQYVKPRLEEIVHLEMEKEKKIDPELSAWWPEATDHVPASYIDSFVFR